MEQTCRGLLAILGIVLLAAILWASSAASFGQSFALITRDPWGLVTLIDLYSGLIFSGVVIFLLEGRRPAAWLWLIASLFLGNLVTALWFVLRAPRLIFAK